MLLGKWYDDATIIVLDRLVDAEVVQCAMRLGWFERPASRLPNGSWPYAWPPPCVLCGGTGADPAILPQRPASPVCASKGHTLRAACPACAGKGYTLRVGPRGATER